jgi:hypothetical protein
MPSQAQKHVTHNEALQRLDAVIHLTLSGFAETDPPAEPEDGYMAGLGAAPTGAWSGQGGSVAYWDGSAWMFLMPQEGWRAWGVSETELRVWRDGSWHSLITQLDNLDGLGVGAVADPVNRLSVSSQAVLLNHDGAGHQLKINKSGAGETASVLFQSGWTGHAEMGLTGDTSWSLKLSSDGLAWHQVMRADPGAIQVDAPITGTAVQSTALDDTADTLLKVGAFGLGASDLAQVRLDNGQEDLPSGFYAGGGSSADMSTFPSGNARYKPFLNMTRRVATGNYGQVRMYFGEDISIYEKTTLSSAWEQVHSLLSREQMLGVVSQNAGVPTGAVIERGANANGEYVRFADGTQICTRRVSVSGLSISTASGSVFRASLGTFTFPASFAGAGADAVGAVIDGSDNTAIRDHAGVLKVRAGSGTLQADWDEVSVWSGLSITGLAGENTQVSLLAVGRWY